MKPTQVSQKKNKKHIKELLKQAGKPPSNKKDCLALADQLTQAREWRHAESCYKSCLRKEPQDFQTLMKLGYVQACAGKLAQAVSTYTACAQLDSQNIQLLNNLAAMCLALHQPVEASDHARAAIKLNERDPNSHYLLAESLSILKDSESEFHYEQALIHYQDVKLDSHSLVKIGRSLRLTNRLEGAIGTLHKAIQANPNLPGAYFELAQSLEQNDQSELAKRAYRRTLELAPKHSEALANYAELMARTGRLDKSAWAYRRLARLFPDNPSFQHLLKANSGETTAGVDENYIKDVFDAYSTDFEDHLVNTLGYQAHQQLHELYTQHFTKSNLRIMDLGCGTGLCGALFRPLAQYIIGIDLSQGMLEEAKKKNIYDNLILSELVSALSNEYQTQDLLIAADVLIYVGALESLFGAAKHALKDHSHLLFSVESMKGHGLKLDSSGRYKHSKSYIEDLCEEHHFKITAAEEVVIRTESQRPVYGINFLLEKTASGA